MKSSTVLLLLMLVGKCLCVECPPLQRGAQLMGHVGAIQGDWRLRSSPSVRLAEGCPLPAGGEVTPPATFATGYARIVIVKANGDLMRPRTCNANQDCSPPIFLPSDPPPVRSAFSKVLDQLMAKLRSDVKKYSDAIILSEGRLEDAILPHSAEGIDLTPVMRKMQPGTYALEFSRLDRGAITVAWSGAATQTSTVPLAMGLYEVRVKGSPQAPAAWALVWPAGDALKEVLSREADLRTAMTKWSADATRWSEETNTERGNMQRTLYRAFLESAAESLHAVR